MIGIVLREGRILVQPRRGDPGLEGLWELPGGKCAPGEGHESALAREVREETGIVVQVGSLLVALGACYPDRRVTLYAYLCTSRGGEPAGLAEWIALAEYRTRPMPIANPPILDALAWHQRSGPHGDQACH